VSASVRRPHAPARPGAPARRRFEHLQPALGGVTAQGGCDAERDQAVEPGSPGPACARLATDCARKSRTPDKQQHATTPSARTTRARRNWKCRLPPARRRTSSLQRRRDREARRGQRRQQAEREAR
jgi:hypothetical protein